MPTMRATGGIASPLKPLWITPPVRGFVVQQHGIHGQRRQRVASQQVGAHPWMGFDDVVFFIGELARLVQHRIRHAHLAQIVQNPPSATRSTSRSDSPQAWASRRLNCATRHKWPPV